MTVLDIDLDIVKDGEQSADETEEMNIKEMVGLTA
jgi:hypothetical protein